ncbi:MAG: TonB-dependent receptor [Acidobacteriia bacterium]|nr:TonB-dependent receptor [Terriglobia bacterium]
MDRFHGGIPAAFVSAILALLLLMSARQALADGASIICRVTDPRGHPVPSAKAELVTTDGKIIQQKSAENDGQFLFLDVPPGEYQLRIGAAGFASVNKRLFVRAGLPITLEVQFQLATREEEVTVTADLKETNVLAPDPAQRVFLREETLDANPGRPGAPVSIPGLPVETASGGIKAPQYFAPGVAGDHGEPIAQYIRVGSYLLSNNLSANAHGNGYADPNSLVPQVIESVQVDGGAFNVREGNHSVNLSAAYGLRPQLAPFATLTGDYRDVDLAAGWNPGGPGARTWIAVQASYGNGFLDRLEHRQQYKFNGYRVFALGKHELALLGIGYYGRSNLPGLVPIDAPNLRDTIDPRQKEQTHTALAALNDDWQPTSKQQISLAGFFRTYNLALDSNFGDGLIRQSEFRTVTGGHGAYNNQASEYFSLLAGIDYQRDAPRRLDLDRYTSTNPSLYGPFQRVTANDVTLGDVAPYIAFEGPLTHRFRYYLGFRRDEIKFSNTDLLVPAHSFAKWTGVNSPKATLSFVPKEQSRLPAVSASAGEAFFTNDPRIGAGNSAGTLASRAHSYQMVISKTLAGTELRLTLGHLTTEASLAKIDPDTGLQFDKGPGRVRFLTLAARRQFHFGMLQASFSKADARDLSTGQATPEAPRCIAHGLGTLDHLPLHLRARGEFEYVGAKPLGDGFAGVPVKEFRAAILRSFQKGRMDVSMNVLVARGYTGQTTETLALPGESTPVERVVGVRLPSYVSLSYTYRFGTPPTR